MRVLVACEYSARVRDAFRHHGHDAWSLDLVATEGDPAFHIQGDLMEHLDAGWDLLVAFPPCTYLTKAGAQLWKHRRSEQDLAIGFVRNIMDSGVPRIAIENPIGILSTVVRKPDQIIHPWWFGEPYTKATCLWLKGLPKLVPEGPVDPEAYWVDSSNKGVLKRGSRNVKDRSRTFLGVARAMANQWA